MMITDITPEQEARFGEWRDKWIRIGLSTEPADFKKATKAALRAYDLCGFSRPKVILRMGSPYGATVGGAMALLMLRKAPRTGEHQVENQVGRQVGNQVWLQVENQVGQQVENQVWQQVENQVGQQVENQVWRQVGNQVWRQVENQIENQVWRQVWDQVGRQVENQVWQQIGQQVKQEVVSKVYNAVGQGLYNYYGGALRAAWCAYVTFLRDVLGWKNPVLEKFSIEENLTTSCGWIWWHQDVLAISNRPSEIHRDEQGNLHNENGPSIAYRDGWKLYHIHGVAVPDFVVKKPQSITVEHIEKERNAEVRRVMVSRMGLERFIRESGLKPIHSDDFGTLYRKDMPDDEPLVVVKVLNSTKEPDGSRKEYFLRVPPTMKRAREAVAWTFNMDENEYLPDVET